MEVNNNLVAGNEQRVENKQEDAQQVYNQAANAQSTTDAYEHSLASIRQLGEQKKKEAANTTQQPVQTTQTTQGTPAAPSQAYEQSLANIRQLSDKYKAQKADAENIQQQKLNRLAEFGQKYGAQTTPAPPAPPQQKATVSVGLEDKTVVPVDPEAFKAQAEEEERRRKAAYEKELDSKMLEAYKDKDYFGKPIRGNDKERGKFTQFRAKGKDRYHTYRIYDNGTQEVYNSGDPESWGNKFQLEERHLPNGDVQQFNGDGEYVTFEALRKPPIYLGGGRTTTEQVVKNAGEEYLDNKDIVGVYNALGSAEGRDIAKRFEDKVYPYYEKYSALSQGQVKAELERQLNIFRTAKDDDAKYEAAIKYGRLMNEYQAKTIGFDNYDKAKSSPGEFDWKRAYISGDAETKRGLEYEYNEFKQKGKNFAASYLNQTLKFGLNQAIAAYKRDVVEGKQLMPANNYINKYCYTDIPEDFWGLYKEQLAARAGVTNLPMRELRDRDFENLSKQFKAATMTTVDDFQKAVDEYYQENSPVWWWIYNASRGSVAGEIAAGINRITGWIPEDTWRILDAGSTHYNKAMGFGNSVGTSLFRIGLDMPAIMLSGGASTALVGGETAMLSAGKRMLHNVLTFTMLGEANQLASDFARGEFSPLAAHASTIFTGALSGACLGLGGEFARTIAATPSNRVLAKIDNLLKKDFSSYFAPAFNKVSGIGIEALAFSLPQFAEEIYSGEGLTAEKAVRILGENAFIVGGLKMKELHKGWKPQYDKADMAELRNAGYDKLADAIESDLFAHVEEVRDPDGKKHLQLALYGDETSGAKAEVEHLIADQASNERGVSWKTFQKVMNMCGRQMTPPIASRVESREIDGKHYVQMLDGAGRVIAQSKGFTDQKKLSDAMTDAEDKLAVQKAAQNFVTYNISREAIVQNEALSRLAEKLNEGTDPWQKNPDGSYVLDENGERVVDPNSTGYTQATAMNYVNQLLDIPEAQRTPEQKQTLKDYANLYKEVKEGLMTPQEIRDMVCGVYGVNPKQLEKVGKTRASKRNKTSKEVQAYETFIRVLGRGATDTSRRIGVASMKDGRVLDIYGMSEMGEESKYFYRDENGNMKMVSSQDVAEYTPKADDRTRLFEVWDNKNNELAKQYTEQLRQEYENLITTDLDFMVKNLEEEYEMKKGTSDASEVAMRLQIANEVLNKRKEQREIEIEEEDIAARNDGLTDKEKAELVAQWGAENGVEYDAKYLMEHPIELGEIYEKMKNGESPVKEEETAPINEPEQPGIVVGQTPEDVTPEPENAPEKDVKEMSDEELQSEFSRLLDSDGATIKASAERIAAIADELDLRFKQTRTRKDVKEMSDEELISEINTIAQGDGKIEGEAKERFIALIDEYGRRRKQPTRQQKSLEPEPTTEGGESKPTTEVKKDLPPTEETKEQRTEKLLDALNIKDEEKRAAVREFYQSDEDAFKEDWEKFFGKEEQPKNEEPVQKVTPESEPEPKPKEESKPSMPMKEEDGETVPDFDKATPTQIHEHLYNSGEYGEEMADKIVKNELEDAQKEVEEKTKALEETKTNLAEKQALKPQTRPTTKTLKQYKQEEKQIAAEVEAAEKAAQDADKALYDALRNQTKWEHVRDEREKALKPEEVVEEPKEPEAKVEPETPKEPEIKVGQEQKPVAEQEPTKKPKAKKGKIDLDAVKERAAKFPKESREESAEFDASIPSMSDEELLAYMKEDGNGDANKAYHFDLYDQYDSRHTDDYLAEYDKTMRNILDNYVSQDEAKQMLEKLNAEKNKLATKERTSILAQSEALENFIRNEGVEDWIKENNWKEPKGKRTGGKKAPKTQERKREEISSEKSFVDKMKAAKKELKNSPNSTDEDYIKMVSKASGKGENLKPSSKLYNDLMDIMEQYADGDLTAEQTAKEIDKAFRNAERRNKDAQYSLEEGGEPTGEMPTSDEQQGESGFVDEQERNLWVSRDEKAADIMESIAKRLGLKIRNYNSKARSRGFISGDTIWVNTNSKSPLGFILGHEMGHDMENADTEAYNRFRELALEQARENYKPTSEDAPQTFDEYVEALGDDYWDWFYNKARDEGKSREEAVKIADANSTKEKILAEIVADESGKILEDAKNAMALLNSEGDLTMRQKLKNFIVKAIDKVLSYLNAGNEEKYAIMPEFVKYTNLKNALNEAYKETLAQKQEMTEEQVKAAEDLDESGFATDNGDVGQFSLEDILEGKEREKAIKDLMRVTGRSEATVKKWLRAEQSLARVILSGDNRKFLDLQVDESVPSIWKNSDYPQGTVEFSNICRKRLPFTVIYQRLQEEFPNRVFDASTLEDIRRIMKENGEDVACGLCFVEDRRQLLGEIGQGFIDALKGERLGAGNQKPIEINEKQRKAISKLIESGDKYMPNLYELLTLDGMKKLRQEHPAVAQAFLEYNNARGMQAGRLFQAYSAYHRDILNWSDAKIKSVNDVGGLRIFSFSDFEAHHLIDLVQVLTDCAAKGVKVQGYTKVPEFAKAVKDTKMKVNRSLIAKGDEGYVDADYVPQEGEAVSPNVIDGKRLLLDTVEGIDVNHPDFFDATNNKNVGNILVGINDEHIKLAMQDPFVDYIIPFHSGLSESIRQKKGIGNWVNYKLVQLEKKYNDNGKLVNADKHGINIYTDVLPRGEELIGRPIRTARDFQQAFFKACAEKGWVPRFSKFINKNKKGEYVYTPGYEKMLIDFKLFDKNGRILEQEAVEPRFDNDFNKQILDKYVEGEKSKVPYDELYGKIKEGLGLNGTKTRAEEMAEQYSLAPRDKEYLDSVERGDTKKAEKMVKAAAKDAMPDTKVVDKDGEPKVVLHGTPNNDFYAFDPEKVGSGTDAGWLGDGFYFYGNNPVYASQYAGKNGRVLKVFLDIKNPYYATEEEFNRLAEANDPELSKQFREELEEDGYDGVYYNGDLNEEWVAFYPNQIKSADPVTYDDAGNVIPLSERFNTEKQDIRYSLEAPTFYSNAERAVEGIKQNKATAEQWKAMLTKAGGIKAGEDKWMGLSAWLDENKGKSLTKDEVLQFVKENGIQMEEVNYGDVSRIIDKYRDEFKALIEQAKTNGIKTPSERGRWAFEQMVKRHGDWYRDSAYIVDMGSNESVLGHHDSLVDNLGIDNAIDGTRLPYTTRGLDNKREIAFVVPNVEPYQKRDRIHFGPENEGKAVMWVRFGETTDADGKRVLVIDEIESKRHQDAREVIERDEKGNPTKRRGYRMEYGALTKERKRIQSRLEYLQGKGETATDAEKAELVKLQERADYLTQQAIEFVVGSKAVPSAPFENNWHEVVMKRMLRLAAEEGFDKVAWTTGEQQAKRYGLGGKIDSIYIGQSRNFSDRYSVMTYDKNADVMHAGTGDFTPKQMEEMFGKSITKQLIDGLNEQGERIGNRYIQYHVDGVDLDVGGEGMKGFYDDMLSRFMNKYGKKWGVKTGTVELPDVEEAGRVMHSVDVTPEMKESVMQGQPLFSLEPMSFKGDKEFADAAKEYNGTMRLTERKGERKGEDYYPTPAPLALIASRILNGNGKDILDIGSGDGMLHKFIKDGNVTAIEKSPDLAEQNRKNTGANVVEGDFLEMNDGKKYPRIILNPPYGNKGEGAYKHLNKAYDALDDNGRMVAILPMGKNADKLYNDFVSRVEADGNRVTANVELPSCTFYKAGIHGSRTRMVVVDKGVQGETQNFDLSGIKTNQDLYESIYKMNVGDDGKVSGIKEPVKAEPTQAQYSLEGLEGDDRREYVSRLREIYRDGIDVDERVRQLDEEFEQRKAVAATMAGAPFPSTGFDSNSVMQIAIDAQMKTLNNTEASDKDRRQAIKNVTKNIRNICKALSKMRFGKLEEEVNLKLEELEQQHNNGEISDEEYNRLKREYQSEIDPNTGVRIAVTAQRDSDRATVSEIVAMARTMMESGLLDDLTRGEVKNIFGRIKEAGGKTSVGVRREVEKLFDIMLNHQEKHTSKAIAELLATPAAKLSANGVKMIGKVDNKTKITLDSMSRNRGKSEEEMRTVISEFTSKDTTGMTERQLDNHSREIEGAVMANRYAQTVTACRNNIVEADAELKRQRERYKNGEITITEYREIKSSLEDIIRNNKTEMVKGLWETEANLRELVNRGKSGAKTFFQKLVDRADKVRHWAYRDLEHVETATQRDKTKKEKFRNTAVHQFFVNSLYTFNTMLRELGKYATYGQGYLYDGFGRTWMENNGKEWKDNKSAYELLNAKAHELFGNLHAFGRGPELPIKAQWHNLIDILEKLPTINVDYRDGDTIKPHALSQAKAAYIYAADKQADGAVKLRAMGISEADVERIKNELDSRVVQLMDWLQEDFLPSLYKGYSEVHERLFGVPMTMTENYFPLEIDKFSIPTTEEGKNTKAVNASTVTGSVKERKFNINPLDIWNTNVVSLVAEHIEQMNHWKNFAEWNRDLNTLLNDARFKRKMQNVSSVYGAGDTFWKHFRDTALIASGDYIPEGSGSVDRTMLNAAKMVSAAKVSMRPFTATKQALSFLTFITQSNPKYFAKNLWNEQGTFKWCFENLPSFEKRWMSRRAGDARLQDTDLDWGWTRSKIVKWASKWGLTPNAAIDLWACAIGARSVYETRRDKYTKMGYSDEEAHQRAVQDAEIAMNETQQSSEKMFVAPVQVDRTWESVAQSVFRTASFGFTRRAVRGMKNLKQSFDFKHMQQNAEYMYKKMTDPEIGDGLTATQAANNIKGLYKRQAIQGLLDICMYAFGAQAMWNIGGKLPYLLASDDDENRLELIKRELIHSGAAGFIEGLPYGNMLSDQISHIIDAIRDNSDFESAFKQYKEDSRKFNSELMPIISDLANLKRTLLSKEYLTGFTDLFNLAVQVGIGVNPQTFSDAFVAVLDRCNNDTELAKEALLMWYRIANVPKSQIENLMIEEIGMPAKDAKKLTVDEVAQRYVYFRKYSRAPYLWELYNDDKKREVEKVYEDRFFEKLYASADDPASYFELADLTGNRRDKFIKKGVDALVEQGVDMVASAYHSAKEPDIKAAIGKAYFKMLNPPKKVDEITQEVLDSYKKAGDEKTKLETAAKYLDSNELMGYQKLDASTRSFYSNSDTLMAHVKSIYKSFSIEYNKEDENGNKIPLGIDEVGWKIPSKDPEKRAQVLDILNKNEAHFTRAMRAYWRNHEVERLIDEIEKAKKVGNMTNYVKIEYENTKKIQQILRDEVSDHE